MNAFLTPGWHRSLWLRRIAAVSLVILAATLSLTRKDPTVVTLSRTVSAGETLAPSDFSRTSVPQSLIPDNAVTDDTAAHGNVAVTTLSRGQILTSTSYTGEGITPAGLTSVPLRLADPATSELLKHGGFGDNCCWGRIYCVRKSNRYPSTKRYGVGGDGQRPGPSGRQRHSEWTCHRRCA